MKSTMKHMATKTDPTGQELLDVPMPSNDAEAATVRDYLARLAEVMWNEGSIKRPFGNSDWHSEVGRALAEAGYVDYEIDDPDYPEDIDYDWREVDRLVSLAAKRLRTP